MKTTASPTQAVLVPTKLAVGAGVIVMETKLLVSSQPTPLRVLLTILLKSVDVDNAEGV